MPIQTPDITNIDNEPLLEEIDLEATDSEIEYELICEVCHKPMDDTPPQEVLATTGCEVCNRFYCTRCVKKFCPHFYTRNVEVYPSPKK